MIMNEKNHLDAAEVQQMLGISAPTFYRWLKSGKLVGTRAGRRWRFSRSAIEQLLAAPSTPSPIASMLLARLRQRTAGDSPEATVQTNEIESTLSDPAALARLALQQALAGSARSLHLEPGAGGWQLRERINGRLTPAPQSLSTEDADQLLTGLKSVVGLAEGQRYGRRQVVLSDRPINLRLAIFPTPQGESATVSLLDPGKTIPTLDELYLSPELTSRLRMLARSPAGMLIVNGPSGSGKTTTLYILLKELARPHRKLMSIEDIVPVLIDGVQQCEAESIGGFSAGLQMMMRSDVDVAMVSEIRDAQVARQVLTMAASGHLVLCSTHAADAGGALRRLIGPAELPVGLVRETLLGILDQRLVPLSCPQCRSLQPASEAEIAALSLPEGTQVARNPGCEACEQRGVRGRTAIAALHEADSLAPLLSGPIPDLSETLWAALSERVIGGDVRPEDAMALMGA